MKLAVEAYDTESGFCRSGLENELPKRLYGFEIGTEIIRLDEQVFTHQRAVHRSEGRRTEDRITTN